MQTLWRQKQLFNRKKKGIILEISCNRNQQIMGFFFFWGKFIQKQKEVRNFLKNQLLVSLSLSPIFVPCQVFFFLCLVSLLIKHRAIQKHNLQLNLLNFVCYITNRFGYSEHIHLLYCAVTNIASIIKTNESFTVKVNITFYNEEPQSSFDFNISSC